MVDTASRYLAESTVQQDNNVRSRQPPSTTPIRDSAAEELDVSSTETILTTKDSAVASKQHHIDIAPSVDTTVEEIIRAEIRSYRDHLTKHYQWGVTLLVSLMTAIFFIRHKVADDLVAIGKLTKGEPLSFYHWLIGTTVLLIVALCCFALSHWLGTQARFHYKALKDLPGRVGPYNEPPRWLRRVLIWLYFVFPATDLALFFVRHYIP